MLRLLVITRAWIITFTPKRLKHIFVVTVRKFTCIWNQLWDVTHRGTIKSTCLTDISVQGCPSEEILEHSSLLKIPCAAHLAGRVQCTSQKTIRFWTYDKPGTAFFAQCSLTNTLSGVLDWKTNHCLVFLKQNTWYILKRPVHHRSLQPLHWPLFRHFLQLLFFHFFIFLKTQGWYFVLWKSIKLFVIFPVDCRAMYNSIPYAEFFFPPHSVHYYQWPNELKCDNQTKYMCICCRLKWNSGQNYFNLGQKCNSFVF